MLDQRGTGRSTPVGGLPGPDPGEPKRRTSRTSAPTRSSATRSDARATSAASDGACSVRASAGSPRWPISRRRPTGLREAFFTGGLPAVDAHIDEVYRATYARAGSDVPGATTTRYPDRDRVLAVQDAIGSADGVRSRPVTGPSSPAAPARPPARHRATAPSSCTTSSSSTPSSPPSARRRHRRSSWARNPIYAILHEACWADGGATELVGERLLPPAEYAEDPTVHRRARLPLDVRSRSPALAPLREPPTCSPSTRGPALRRRSLARNDVPAAAAIYAEDMYVERTFSEQTAPPGRGLRPWITNEYEHNGLRADGAGCSTG